MRRIAIILVLFQLIGCAPYKLTDMHANMATTLGQLHRRVSELHKRVDVVDTQHDTLQPAPTNFYTKLGVGLGIAAIVVTILCHLYNRNDIDQLNGLYFVQRDDINALKKKEETLRTGLTTLTSQVNDLAPKAEGSIVPSGDGGGGSFGP